jgi:hypothetical protein
VVLDQVCDSPAERVMAERPATTQLDWFAAYLASR